MPFVLDKGRKVRVERIGGGGRLSETIANVVGVHSRLVVILICGEQPRIRRRGQSTIINSHLQAVFALNDAEGIDEIPLSLRSNTLPLNNPQAIRT
jgi:hypothetical protein